MKNKLFPNRPKNQPVIYAYRLLNIPDKDGLLKIGFTTRSAKERVHEQLITSGVDYEICLVESAMRNDGTTFSDHEIHQYLKNNNFKNPYGEWFECDIKDVQSAIVGIKNKLELHGYYFDGKKLFLMYMDKYGNIAMPFNSAGMFRGYKKEGENGVVKIFGDE